MKQWGGVNKKRRGRLLADERGTRCQVILLDERREVLMLGGDFGKQKAFANITAAEFEKMRLVTIRPGE